MSQKTALQLERAWSKWTQGFPAFMEQLDRKKTPYLSHSKVALFQRCPLCYYRQYILGEKQDSEAMHLGQLFHETAAHLYSSTSSFSPSRLIKRIKTKRLDVDRIKQLHNAITLLCQNGWFGLTIASVEEPFFLTLARGLPPIIGVADLVLRNGDIVTVIDHKTSTKFNDHDHGQLVLYAEHARIHHGARKVNGFFDEYRLVPDLSKIRKPVFRRMPAEVSKSFLSHLVRRYRKAWTLIRELKKGDEPSASSDCWICRPPARRHWY
jgi:hypothetical protein